jgi:hypothetical protein
VDQAGGNQQKGVWTMRVTVTSIEPAPPEQMPLLAYASAALPDLGLTVAGIAVLAVASARSGLAISAPRHRRDSGDWAPSIRFDDKAAYLAVANAVRAAWLARAGAVAA